MKVSHSQQNGQFCVQQSRDRRGIEWQGRAGRELPFSVSPPVTSGRRVMNSCYHHYYEYPRLTSLAPGAITAIIAIPSATALFQAFIIILQNQNFSKYV